ncbi:MAG TPA: DUF2007 domain-containing protein [Pyrinomonadaceae bacterium]|nr:DUF2007 domain-containing protein [Pyrinomonadaceae bacterium]
MSDETFVLKVFNNEIDAEMAQQVLSDSDVHSFIFKDDAGGMEPHLQMTGGVNLIVNRVDAARAQELLQTLRNSA